MLLRGFPLRRRGRRRAPFRGCHPKFWDVCFMISNNIVLEPYKHSKVWVQKRGKIIQIFYIQNVFLIRFFCRYVVRRYVSTLPIVAQERRSVNRPVMCSGGVHHILFIFSLFSLFRIFVIIFNLYMLLTTHNRTRQFLQKTADK
jgi:hypothetical protein